MACEKEKNKIDFLAVLMNFWIGCVSIHVSDHGMKRNLAGDHESYIRTLKNLCIHL